MLGERNDSRLVNATGEEHVLAYGDELTCSPCFSGAVIFKLWCTNGRLLVRKEIHELSPFFNNSIPEDHCIINAVLYLLGTYKVYTKTLFHFWNIQTLLCRLTATDDAIL
jgi:hypothetical protein